MVDQLNFLLRKLLLLFLFFTPCLGFAQHVKTANFLKNLIEKEYSKGDSVTIELDDTSASIYIHEEGDPWSVYFSILDHTDLNNDSIHDYIIDRNSEGMLGGNVKSNSNISYYTMLNDSTIKDEYTILLYAPFSYNIGDSVSYDKGSKILTIHFIQNFRTYDSEDGLQETTKKFRYIDNNLYELSYLDECELSKMINKNIFKEDIQGVERSLSIDMHDYTEVSSESLIQDSLLIEASIYGCDNMSLSFGITINNNTSALSQKDLLQTLSFLADNTRFKSLMNKAYLYVNKLDVDTDLTTITSIGLGNQWLFNFSDFNDGKASNKRNYRFRFIQEINKNQNENWEITTRRK